MALAPLPEDLIESIVYQLGVDKDIEALRQCNLTSRSFRIAAEKNIFASTLIPLNPTESTIRRLQSFREILMASPNIGTYVQKLEVEIDPSCPAGTPTSLIVLSMMPCVRTLAILPNQRIRRMPAWPQLHVRTQEAILGLLSRPTIRTVIVGSMMVFPVRVLSYANQAERIELLFDHVMAETTDEPMGLSLSANNPSISKILPRSLKIRASRQAVARRALEHLFLSPNYPVAGDSLEELSVGFTISSSSASPSQVSGLNHNRALQHILNTSPNLAKLELDIDGQMPDPLDLSSSHRLRELIIVNRHRQFSLGVEWIIQTLETLSSVNPLRTMALNLGDTFVAGGEDDRQLGMLDGLLGASSKFSHCHIHIDISCTPERMEGILVNLLPLMVMKDTFSASRKGEWYALETIRPRVRISSGISHANSEPVVAAV